jgi:TRAP-type C4-dicarboxylate transport system permease small subunit
MTMAETSTRQAGARAGLLVAVADGVDRAVGIACRLIVLAVGIAILLILTSNIVARYALASGGFRFAQELPERLFPWFIMAGVVLAVQKGGHLAVEMLADMLGRGARRVLLLVSLSIVIAAYGVLGYQAMMVAEMSWIDLSPILRMPVSYGYYALALGCAGIMLTSAAIAVRVAVLGPEALPTADPEEQPT